jgi:pimeloyl-ACP methyl ester carboxylesterase
VPNAVWSHEVGPEAAPLIVLVHGAMDRSAGMLKLSRKLDDTFHVLRYDRRGYGRSKPHDGPFTMEHHVEDLAALVGGRRALVFGHSYGGNVALALAERRPELVRAVAVYEVPLSWTEWWPGFSRRNPAATAGTTGDAAEQFMRRMVGDRRWDMIPERVREERRSEGEAFVSELGELAQRAPWTAAGIDVPFVVMFGEHAREHHRDASRYLAEELSDRDAIEIPDANHNGPFTHPDAVAAVIRDLAERAPD